MKLVILPVILILSYLPTNYSPISFASKALLVESEKVVIKLGESVTKFDQNIKFVDVLEDSRCPKGVHCIWAGNAKISIEVGQNNQTKKIELNTLLEPQEDFVSGYKIRLVGLSPYPEEGKQINKAQYTASLEISKQ
jgi:hypothetical protein